MKAGSRGNKKMKRSISPKKEEESEAEVCCVCVERRRKVKDYFAAMKMARWIKVWKRRLEGSGGEKEKK